VSAEQQQDLFGLFRPQPGVHRVPPVAPHHHAAPAGEPAPDAGPGEVIFQRSCAPGTTGSRSGAMAWRWRQSRRAAANARRCASSRRHRDWLERARERQRHRPRSAEVWTLGTHVLWRGELTEIRTAIDAAPPGWGGASRPAVCLAADVFRVARLDGDLRPTLEAHFARRAKIELPARTWELAAETGMEIKQGDGAQPALALGLVLGGWYGVVELAACADARPGARLYHLPRADAPGRDEPLDAVSGSVEAVCPAGWREAERWLKRNGSLLGLVRGDRNIYRWRSLAKQGDTVRR